jgi:hypothetical protein
MRDDAGRRENDESILKDLELSGRNRMDQRSMDGLGGFVHDALFVLLGTCMEIYCEASKIVDLTRWANVRDVAS